MACLLAKIDRPKVDPRKPYTEIGDPILSLADLTTKPTLLTLSTNIGYPATRRRRFSRLLSEILIKPSRRKWRL